VKSPLDLIIYGMSENEVLFNLNLLERTKLTYPIYLKDVVIRFNMLQGRENPRLIKGNPEAM